MRPLTGSARALHRIRSGDEVTDSGSSTHSRRGGRRRSGRQNCKSNQRGKQYSQNGSPPAGHMQPQPDCDTGQVVTATCHTALRIRGTARAEEDSALEQSVELMASVRDIPLPMTLARFSVLMPFRALSSGSLRVARDPTGGPSASLIPRKDTPYRPLSEIPVLRHYRNTGYSQSFRCIVGRDDAGGDLE